MDWILAWSTVLVSLAAFIFLHFNPSETAKRFCRFWPTLTQKIMFALLLGFSVFAAVSRQVPRLSQKVIVIGVAAALIAAMGIQFHPKE